MWPSVISDKLFIRDFYGQFYDTFITYRNCCKLIICGTPGIGKSAFGSYCIYRALTDGKTVIYQTLRKNHICVFKGEKVTELNDIPSELLADIKNSLYICDGVKPIFSTVQCPTVLITSPKKAIWNAFSKDEMCEMKWFGRWDRSNELELLRKHCYPNITKSMMNKQVLLWGKIPRSTFTNPKRYTEKELIELIKLRGPELLIKSSMIKETGKEDTIHRLIHIIPNDTFDNERRDFASDFVGNEIFRMYSHESLDRLKIVLTSVSDAINVKSYMNTFFGRGFERVAGLTVAAGGNFNRINMSNGKRSMCTIPQFEKIERISHIDDVKLENDTYLYIPNSKIFTSIDFLTVRDSTFSGFNATIDLTHNIILDSADGKSGLWRYWKAILTNIKPAPASLDFYFAVPDDCFKQFSTKKPSFKWNQLKNKSKENNILRPTNIEKKEFEKLINCYIIAIPIETSIGVAEQIYDIKTDKKNNDENNNEKSFGEKSNDDFDAEKENYNKDFDAEKENSYDDFDAEKEKSYDDFDAEKENSYDDFDAEKEKSYDDFDAEKEKSYDDFDAEKEKSYDDFDAEKEKSSKDKIVDIEKNIIASVEKEEEKEIEKKKEKKQQNLTEKDKKEMLTLPAVDEKKEIKNHKKNKRNRQIFEEKKIESDKNNEGETGEEQIEKRKKKKNKNKNKKQKKSMLIDI
jgi:hypothetical protein